MAKSGWHFRISFKEWKSWVGIGLVSIGAALFFTPIQDYMTQFVGSTVGQGWPMMAIGGIVAAASMYFFKVA